MSVDVQDLAPADVSVPVTTEDATSVSVDPATPAVAEAAETQTPVVPDPPRDESERLEPIPTGPITLESGTEVEVVPLRLRETMKLLKIVTRGAGSVLEQLMGELDMEDPAAFAQTLGALVIMSIPEAEDEAVAFIQAMVAPANETSLTTQEKITARQSLAQELSNPDLNDTISIIERVIRRESEDIRNLGKRIGAAFKVAGKVGLSA